MEKRLFAAFFIILAFFMFWSKFAPKQPSQVMTQPVVREEVAVAPQSRSVVAPEEISLEQKLPRIIIGDFIIEYSPLGGYLSRIFMKDNGEALSFENIGYFPQDKDKQFKALVSSNRIEFKGPGGIRKDFIFQENSVVIKSSPPPSEPIIIFSNALSAKMLEQRYQEVFYSRENVIKRSAAKKVKDGVYRNVDFAGARGRYYCLALTKGLYDIEWVKTKEKTHTYLNSPSAEISLYLGPQTEKALKPFGLQRVMHYGFFHSISMLMIKLLTFLYSITKNWGISIILFAIAIYFLLFPFTSKSTKAMKQMQQIQPEIEELKKKHGSNAQKLQKETVELYRKYKINPLGGCLPLFLQFPVFIALYQVLFRFVELKGAGFLWINDLSAPDHFLKLPFQGPIGFVNLLPLLIVAVGLIQQKVTSSSGSAQQKQMGLFFAVFLGVIFYNFPSSLVLYWFVQNILTLAYQVRISKA